MLPDRWRGVHQEDHCNPSILFSNREEKGACSGSHTEQAPKKAKSKTKGKAKAKAIEKKSGVLGAEPETAAMIQEDVSYVLSASGFAEEPLPAGRSSPTVVA